jgi:enoyl-CoA hydratase/carnithine racemase
MTEDVLLRDDRDGVAWLTLHRPEAYNALSLGLIEALTQEAESIAGDPSVRAVIIQGAGRGFCAGHDMRQLRDNATKSYYDKTFAASSRLMLTLVRLPQPVIAKVHGIATAAGSQLLATCDLAVAAETARFGTPGVNIGLFCSTPMVALSRNIGRKRAMQMLLTGEMIDAETALSFGLINEAVPEERLDEAAAAWAEKVKRKSSHVLKIGKQAFYQQLEMGLEDAYRYAAGVMSENMLAKDAEEGIDAFLEKRQPQWQDA